MVSNVQMMRDLYAALGRGDMATVFGAMDPGIEWREAEGNPYEPSGYKQTGKELDAQVCHLWTIRGGKVTSFQQYVDTAQLQDVEGAR
jgi:ketosteroid isomerase-like protein